MDSPRPSLGDDVRLSREIAEQIQAAGISEDDPDFADLLASETDIQARLCRILRYGRHVEAQAKALGEMLSEMRDRKARLERKAESLRSVALWAMSEVGLKKLEAPDLSASVSMGKPKVILIDEALLPDELCRIERSPNKTALANALQHGPIPGAELSNPQPSLRVLTR